MHIKDLLEEIRQHLVSTFHQIDLWFDREEEMRQFQPPKGGWSINQVLEHIGLTNHFLLILIEKGTNKAVQLATKEDLPKALEGYVFHRDNLTEVGLHQSFDWNRPDHMEPTGKPSIAAVRQQLKDQVELCLTCLRKLANGEGVLYKTTMTVNELGKIDVYEYIHFLAQHGHRHIQQMEKIEAEYKLAK